MPVFMLVSGYLFAFSIQKRNLGSAIIQKIKTLLIPILLWSVISFGLSMISMIWHNETISLFICFRRYVSTVLNNLWFLWAIFWCSIVVIIVNKVFRDSKIIYIMGALLTFFIPDVLNLHLYKFMYPFFVLGYFYNVAGIKNKYNKFYSSNLFFGTCGIIFALLLTMYNRESYIYTSGMYLFRENPLHQLYIDIYRFLIGLIGSIFVMLFIEKTYKFLNTKILSTLLCIGQNSMGIYIISGYLFNYLLYRIMYPLRSINYLITILETVAILIISLLLTLWIKKVKTLNQFLLGGRV